MNPSRNLGKLHNLTSQFENPEEVECYFVGALSALVSDDDWEKALMVATDCATTYGAKKVDTKRTDEVAP